MCHACFLMTDTQLSLQLMQAVIEHRHNKPLRDQISKVNKVSMLHGDVLALVHYLARICEGDILEIGSFVGGSTISAALGIRASGRAKRFISIEPGGRLKGHHLATRNIFKQLRKNLNRFGVLESVTLINRAAEDPAAIAEVREAFAPGSIGFFIFDAHNNVKYDVDCYADLLANDCWVMIDDYFGPSEKAGPTQVQVDELVASGHLIPLGYYGWGTWFGQWRA